jgi:hypothetical protein
LAKVTINGEVYPFDMASRPMSEALIIEEGLGCTFTEWEAGVRKGSARAMCGMIWAVLHRNGHKENGREVEIKDILSGDFPVDLNEIEVDMDGDGDPTSLPPDPLSSTAAGTSGSSVKSSGSARGKLGSSPRTSSRP